MKLAVGTGRKEHAAHIYAAWQKGVDAVIETGLRIIDARDGLDHGEYLTMVTEDLNFSRSTAFKLVRSHQTKPFRMFPNWGTFAGRLGILYGPDRRRQ